MYSKSSTCSRAFSATRTRRPSSRPKSSSTYWVRFSDKTPTAAPSGTPRSSKALARRSGAIDAFGKRQRTCAVFDPAGGGVLTRRGG